MATLYRIGVEIALVGAFQEALGAISSKLLGINRDVKLVEMGFRGWSAVLGGLGVVGGATVLGGLKAIADRGETLLHQQNALFRATQDWRGVVNLTADAYSRIAKEVPTAAASDILRSINELRSVTGSMASAEAIAPMSLKMEALLENLTGHEAEGAGFALWRALEMKGITASDPSSAQRLAYQMVQNISGSGGKIDANTYQAMAKTGGVAWIHATPEAIAGPYSVAGADLGGDRAGTAIMTLYQMLQGAVTMSRQQVDVLEKAGLLDMNKVHKVRGSNAMQIDPGAIYGSLEDSGNLYKWVQAISPRLHALAEKMASAEGQNPETVFESLLAKIGRNRNATRMLTMFSDPGFIEQIQKDLVVWGQNMPLDRAYATMLGRPSGPASPTEAADMAGPGRRSNPPGDYVAVMSAFEKQWQSLMEAVGGPTAQAAIPVLQSLTSAFSGVGEWANVHPDAIQNVATAAAALGAAFTALGGAAVVGAAAMLVPGGAVAVAIIGIGVAVAAVAAIKWGDVLAALSGFGKGYMDAVKAMEADFSNAGPMISAAFVGIESELAKAIQGIPAAVGGAIAGLPAAIGGAIGSAVMNAVSHLGAGGAAAPVPGQGAPFPSLTPHVGPSLVPKPPGSQSMNTHGHVYLDGAKVGSVLWRSANRSGGFSVQAAHFDSGANYAGGDYSFSNS